MNGYELSRNWFDWAFENPEKVTIGHTAVYFFSVEWCNRLSWKEKFGLPSSVAMEALGIKKHDTYNKYFNDLVDWGFISLIQKAKNQYTANIISLQCAIPKSGEALGLASGKHAGQQPVSIGGGTGSIDKPITYNQEPITNLPLPADKGDSEFDEALNTFDVFRKAYKGEKAGNETEFNNFRKKHKDWKQVLPILFERVTAEIADKEKKRQTTGFAPNWANLSTYINNRRWERYEPENIPTPSAQRNFDFSISRESENTNKHEQGREQVLVICHQIGYKNASKSELNWVYDFQHPFGIVLDKWEPNELLTDRGLAGTSVSPNSLQEVMGNG